MAFVTESRRYWYLVSFYYSGKSKKGFGSFGHRLNHKDIKDRDLDEMIEHAQKHYKVEDVVILSISFLGHMTTEEKKGIRG